MEQFILNLWDNQNEESINILLKNRNEFGVLLLELQDDKYRRYNINKIKVLSNLISLSEFEEELKPKDLEF